MWARRSAPTAWASPQLCQLCQLCQPCQPRDLPCTWSGHDKHARPKWDTSVPTLRLRDTPASSSLRVPSRAHTRVPCRRRAPGRVARVATDQGRTERRPGRRSRCVLVTIYPVIVDSFRCAAKDLARYRLESESMSVTP